MQCSYSFVPKTVFIDVCALLIITIIVSVTSSAQVVTDLANFHEGNGELPNGVLVQGRDGNLYGTTALGGPSKAGTVFRMNPAGRLVTLHNFNLSDGYEPSAMVMDKYGDFYGITTLGGATGQGTIFKITSNGVFTSLYNLGLTDGDFPNSFVAGPDGNFYGTTEYAGGAGSFFRVTPDGGFTRLECSVDRPVSLTLDIDGNFYGAAWGSGGGYGSIFEIRPDGKCSTLHNFSNTDGDLPIGLTTDKNGNLFGVTVNGGSTDEGTFFEVTENGEFTNLYSFPRFAGFPGAALTYGDDGNFYGTTPRDGGTYQGTIFEFTPAGDFTVLHSFQGDEAYDTQVAMTQHTNGTFYGPSYEGGKQGEGDIYSLNTGLSPFLGFVAGFGHVGANVQFLGQGFVGTTGVSFNGVVANSFKVVSDTYMTAVVPVGATTGLVTVTTKSGSLTSSRNFVVH